jgi:hypothetical protein
LELQPQGWVSDLVTPLVEQEIRRREEESEEHRVRQVLAAEAARPMLSALAIETDHPRPPTNVHCTTIFFFVWFFSL